MENQLTSLEKKIDDLLASLDEPGNDRRGMSGKPSVGTDGHSKTTSSK